MTQLSHRFNFRLILLVAFAIYALFLVQSYWSIFGGDPEIHIIFAKNFLDGYPFQFNKGEYTSGETSPLYMAVVAGFLILSPAHTPLLMKLTGLFSLVSIAYNTFISLDKKPYRDIGNYIYAFATVMTPFMIFQASLGMENMLFAAMVVYLLRRILLEGSSGFAVFFIIPFLLFLLRPEAALLLIALILIAGNRKNWVDAAFSAAALLSCFLFLLIFELYTGVPLHGAGNVRAMISRFYSVHFSLGGYDIFLNKKPWIIIPYCLPLILFFLKNLSKIGKNGLIPLVLLFCAPFALHVFNLFPNTHFTRYFLYSYSTLVLLFGIYIFPHLTSKYKLFLLIFPLLPGLIEFQIRQGTPKEDYRNTIIQFNDTFRERFSKELISRIEPVDLPVSIAVREVQIRGRLDERFIVRSLDGIVDHKLKEHLHKNGIDHFGYIKARNIDLILETPSYASGPRSQASSQASLDDLNAMNGPVIEYEGLCFSRFSLAGLEGISMFGNKVADRIISDRMIFGNSASERTKSYKKPAFGYKLLDCN